MRQTNGESGLRPLAVCEPILRHVPETSRMHPLLAARGSRASSDHHCAEARGTVHPVGVGRRNAGSTACELIGVTTGRRVHRPDQRRRPTGCHGIPATTSQPTCSAVVTALLPARCGLMGAGTSHPASAIAAAHAAGGPAPRDADDPRAASMISLSAAIGVRSARRSGLGSHKTRLWSWKRTVTTRLPAAVRR